MSPCIIYQVPPPRNQYHVVIVDVDEPPPGVGTRSVVVPASLVDELVEEVSTCVCEPPPGVGTGSVVVPASLVSV